jgi:hypothetical protein
VPSQLPGCGATSRSRCTPASSRPAGMTGSRVAA